MKYTCAFHSYLKIAMRFTISLLFLFNNADASKKYVIATNVNLIDGQLGVFKDIIPGDTIWLEPGIRTLLILRNLNGTSTEPIVIMNNEGVVEVNSNHYFGISIRRSSFIKLTGTGDSSNFYGIRILNIQGSGLSIGDFTSDFEVDHVEVGYAKYSGLIAKTEPDCDFNRNLFTQFNTVIHHNYIHHSGNEGMYIGSSFYSGQTINCNGTPTVILPALLKNVSIHHNIVEYAGWDGIQVSSAINTEIYSNSVKYDSQQKVDWQMTGITLGGGSTGIIRNNIVKDGEGTGIFTNGIGDIKIYNNIIKNPGKSNSLSSGAYGIYINDKFSFPGMYFSIGNNLILNSKKEAIRMLCYNSNLKNQIFNNILIKETTKNNEAISIEGNLAIETNNLCQENTQQLFFENENSDNYNLKELSLAIDAGSNLLDITQHLDFNNHPRVNGNRIDIGPCESTFARFNNVISDSVEANCIAFPNPISNENFFTIQFYVDIPGLIYINSINQNGQTLKLLYQEYLDKGNHAINVSTNELLDGLNWIQISRVRDKKMVEVVKNQN